MINHFKTAILLAALTGLMLGIGQLFGGRTGLTIAIIFALIMNFGSFWFSHKIVLAMYRAKKADEHEYSELHQIVSEVAQQAGIPKPQVYIIPAENANAFATGRSHKNAVVACTVGIMNLLSKEELKGVIAHEISHVKNRDMLVTTIAATIAGVISYLAMMAQFAAIFGGSRDDRNGSNMIGLLAMAIVTPIVAAILQLAISRSREYLADSSGAKLLKNGEPLAKALEKLENSASRNPMRMGNQATASLFIVNPFRGGMSGLFSTHPPLAQRAKRLREMRF
ncbi:zinc metalloprotease HtpX [Candidatus Woesearchaeota archaeon]|nr:zinc metalloprotease HtpX [Candidatus Woesearchaeota archaeon]